MPDDFDYLFGSSFLPQGYFQSLCQIIVGDLIRKPGLPDVAVLKKLVLLPLIILVTSLPVVVMIYVIKHGSKSVI